MNKVKKAINSTLTVFLLLAFVSIVLAALKLGFALWFWLILIIWIALLCLLLFTTFFRVILYFWLTVIIWLIVSLLLVFNVIPIANDSKSNKDSGSQTVNEISLADCTSTISNQPTTLADWKVVIYSGPLRSLTPTPAEANNVRTFSYQGIKNKTEANSVYADLRRSNDNMISGYDTTIEVCNSDNKANSAYVTKNTNSPVGEGVVASNHYLQGGAYLFGPGTYRVDAYVKDLNGTWHLLARMENITVTD
jgi:hypothetical protein